MQLLYCTKRRSQKGGAWHNAPLNTFLRGGFRQLWALRYLVTLIGRPKKKRSSRPQTSCFH